MTFNTDMPFPEFTVMSPDHAAECVADPSCDAAVANEPAAAVDARAPKRRIERTDGRSRRFRFGDAIEDAPPRAMTGSIAISFAVVSRRNWPR
ncbi:hypothetical protein BBJ41_22155 [Burkholderia stabilis]|uniref:hypothetical protein n=1 Tax=Burkholderia stabilis TaxID=95485 RepID=UPI000851ACE7|nr:hypothetical protein [Burkholderia stabilis]AOR70272.1 hypothetical protein BBJ41_22155 [Burkholderia stabilis]HDR9494196.1 hypothetical protein [Burkholderia stabilis]HDR9527723.1 hypothetical protein [Burkholderia stabilis]HDR9531781.1 hypothetical protein [Burkholderia stabilis]HDR9541164.1 hypothetical protein [Burkholderia stabilis]